MKTIYNMTQETFSLAKRMFSFLVTNEKSRDYVGDWGGVYQNNNDDNMLYDMFDLFKSNTPEVIKHNFNAIRRRIESKCDDMGKRYNYRRLAKYISSVILEYMFATNENCKHSEFANDKNVDVILECCGIEYPFDIKGTNFPKEYRTAEKTEKTENLESCFLNANDLINWYYIHQSKGNNYHTSKRYNMNESKLFVVAHSYRTPMNEMRVWSNYDLIESAINGYIKSICDGKPFGTFVKCTGKEIISDVIFLIENADGSMSYKLCYFE